MSPAYVVVTKTSEFGHND